MIKLFCNSVWIVSTIVLFSCSNENALDDNPYDNSSGDKITINVNAETGKYVGGNDNQDVPTLTWLENDFVIAGALSTVKKPDQLGETMLSGFSKLEIIDGAGSVSGSFNGKILEPADNEPVYVFGEISNAKVYYSSKDKVFKVEFPVTGLISTNGVQSLMDNSFMAGKGSIDNSNTVNVSLESYASVINFRISGLQPSSSVYSATVSAQDKLFPVSATISPEDMALNVAEGISALSSDFAENNLTSAEGVIDLYCISYAPLNAFNGKSVSLKLMSSSGYYNCELQIPDASSSNFISVSGEAKVEEFGYEYLSLNMPDLIKIKEGYVNEVSEDVAYVNGLKTQADKEIASNTTYTIVNKPYFPPGVDKHDYVSVRPYMWPNPDTPDGYPYINKDGQVNPESRTKYTDQTNLSNMCSAVENLGLTYFYTGDIRYAQRIEQIVKVFFLNEDTYMKPHLNFGQATPTKDAPEGSAFGMIESAGFAKMLEGFNLACVNGAVSQEVVDGMKEWFSEFLNWCNTSPIAIDERGKTNNHGTHYDRQTIAYRLFLGSYNGTDYLNQAIEYLNMYTKPRLTQQISADGCQEEEVSRTKSWNYSNMNLTGFYQVAIMAEKLNVNLWEYKGGRNVPPLQAAIDWYLPYLSKQKSWTYEQILKQSVTMVQESLEIAAQKYNDKKYLDAIDNFQTIHDNITFP